MSTEIWKMLTDAIKAEEDAWVIVVELLNNLEDARRKYSAARLQRHMLEKTLRPKEPK